MGNRGWKGAQPVLKHFRPGALGLQRAPARDAALGPRILRRLGKADPGEENGYELNPGDTYIYI